MRTTIDLDDEQLAAARRYLGPVSTRELVRDALRALIEREAAARLASLGGSDRRAAPPPRR